MKRFLPARPWKFDGHGINAADGERIAKVSGPGPYDEDNKRVNAFDRLSNLLAASPEMYECIASFVRRFGVAVECDEEINGGDAVDWIGENMPEFRNALKKARGVK
jgi:hypothetical protein